MNAEFICGDSGTALKELATGSVRLVVSSPPYAVGKSYEDKFDNVQAYIESTKPILSELHRILVPGGSVCWQVGNYVNNGEIIPLDILFWPLFKSLGFSLRNRIVWTFGHGLHCKKRLSGRYETILWFTKGDDYLFNLDPIRVPQKYPGKKYFKGPKKGQLSCNPLGANPGDIWTIPNVKHNHVEKTTHPCQFPSEIPERLILALSNENDLVCDPFSGSGTTGIAAMIHNRRSICIDKEQKYIDIANERVRAYREGKLDVREWINVDN
jgi:adenine-specific DNA-methyltransferase